MGHANKESISIPFGTGICGHVAETKETIYIKDAYKVETFQTFLLLLICIAYRIPASTGKSTFKRVTPLILWSACQSATSTVK